LRTILNAVVCLLLLAGVAASQTTAPTPTLKPRPADPNELVPNTVVSSDTPVITVKGLCPRTGNGNATPADCDTVITRAEFEKIVAAVQPNMPLAARKQFATRYVTVLLLADKAHELGLDKGPQFDEQMYLTRLQLLAREAGEAMQKNAANVSDSAVSDYYQQHMDEYKTLSFDRIFVPRQKQVETAGQKPDNPEAQKKQQASEAAMKAEADKLRARAAAGEDFAKLQQEAYEFAGSKAKPGPVKMENQRKNNIPPTDSSIFNLKKGDVSEVYSDPSGYRIYKIEETTTLPLASVHEEIAHAVQGQNLKSSFEALQNSAKATYDDRYFVTPAPPSLRHPNEAPTTQAPPPGKK
jgi:parvulin-like peptidyl-prolyl cis-trans isomerase-like protein